MSPDKGSSKLLMLHVPGADLQFIHPLVDAGLMPNFAALIEHGSIGNLHATPLLRYPTSTMTLATGVRADKHHIFGPVTPDAAPQHGARPSHPSDLRARPVWDIVSERGGRGAAIGWPVSYPAPHRPDTLIVSDVFAHATGGGFDDWPFDPASVSDPNLHETFDILRLHPSEVSLDMLLPFLSELDSIDLETDERIAALRVILARTLTLHAAGTWVVEHHPCDFIAVNFDFVERLTSAFFEFSAPRMGHVTKRDFARYSNVVAGAYRMFDLMLAPYLQLLGDRDHVIITSAHGVVRPEQRAFKTAKVVDRVTAHYSSTGLIVAKGPLIKPDDLNQGASTLDVTPTALAILGYPIPEGLDGQVFEAMFVQPPQSLKAPLSAPDYVTSHTSNADHDIRRMYEWQVLGYCAKLSPDPEVNLEHLKVVGWLAHAETLMIRGDTAGALDKLRHAHALVPSHRNVKFRIMQCALSAGEIEECRAMLDDLKASGVSSHTLDFIEGHLVIAEGDVAAGDALFDALEDRLQVQPQGAPLFAGIGDARLKAGLTVKAKASYARAVDADANSVAGLNGLGETHLKLQNFEVAETALSASLKLSATQTKTLAMRGYARFGAGRFAGAQEDFDMVLAHDPSSDYARDGLKALQNMRVSGALKAGQST